MKPTSRITALSAKETRYFTGRPCKSGHVAERYAANSMCIPCAHSKARKWKSLNPEKVKKNAVLSQQKRTAANPAAAKLKSRKFALLRHGLSLNDYYDILADQGGGCAICYVKPVNGPLSLSIDHDHAHCPGEYGCEECVRGLLCSKCNTSLGGFKDDAQLLMRAVDYLDAWRRKSDETEDDE